MSILRVCETKGTEHVGHKKDDEDDDIDAYLRKWIIAIIAIIVFFLILGVIGAKGYDQNGVAVNTTNATTNIRNAEKKGQVLAKVDQYVYVDVSTGVQYIMEDEADSGGACLMVDADGKPLINKTWKRLHSDDVETDSGGNKSSTGNASKSTSADASKSDTDAE